MDSILFITSEFLPMADANGICIYNLAKEFLRSGYNVYVIADQTDSLSEREIIEQIHIYRLPVAWFKSFYNRFGNAQSIFARIFYHFVHLIRNFFIIPTYPNTSPLRAQKVYQLAHKLISQHGINNVVSAYRPYEGIYAAKQLKKAFGSEIRICSLYLDILQDRKKTAKLGWFYRKATDFALRSDFKIFDGVLIPESHHNEYIAHYGTSRKLFFFDFPLYTQSSFFEPYDFPFSNSRVNVVYLGSLDASNRNPSEIFSLLRFFSRNYLPVTLHLWGNHKGIDELLCEYSDVVEHHGVVEYRYVTSIFSQADILLNISNKDHYDMIPSKIFQMFSSGKRIVNFVYRTSDASLPYFNRYEKAHSIFLPIADLSFECSKLAAFLSSNSDAVPMNDRFVKNTPAYVAKTVVGCLQHETQNQF